MICNRPGYRHTGMRIGYLHPTDFPSVEANVVQVVQMCRAFGNLGHDVTLFIPRAPGFADDAAALERSRELFGDPLPFRLVFVPRVRFWGRGEVIGTVRSTLRALRRYPVDLIYTRNVWSVPFLPRMRTPFVFEAHDAHLHLSSRLLGSIIRRSIVRASQGSRLVKVVTISEALKKVYHGFGVPESKLVSAHDAVDLAMFGEPLSKQAAREKLGLSSDRRAVVYTGALKDDRGIDLILRSAQQLRDLDFYMVGGSPSQIEHWRVEARELGIDNARFPGKVPHTGIPLWLAAADVLLMMWTWRVPTIEICSPMKLFEYMAAGRHIVGPAFPTVCEVMEDGKDGILFEPDDLEAMIVGLRRALDVLDDPSMPLAARRKAEAEYTWGARARRILDSLPDLAGTG